MIEKDKKLVNDEIDLISLFAVVFDNFNLLLSIFITSLFVISVYYLSATKLYQSSSLLEIKKSNNTSFLPESLRSGLNSGLSNDNSLQAEMEIYKSNDTVVDALNTLEKMNLYEVIPSLGEVKGNLYLETNSQSLITINFVSDDQELNPVILNLLNKEFIKDRRDFIKQSSAAGKNFIQKEIPRIKILLKEAEDNLNSFKVSTNTSDVIFDTNTRNLKLERLRNRVNEIAFKELELKEFYKENHPIYLTLSEQKKLVLSQINEIEIDLPNIPTTQRALENFKREVEIYSNVLRELSSQELSLGMAEASSLSNVRIINEASSASKISPRRIMFSLSFIFLIIAYIILLVRHFLGDKITNLDALADFIGKEKIIGELPFIDTKKDKSLFTKNIAEELLNKTIYEITHNEYKGNSFSIVSSRKDAGKSEISVKLFNKLKEKYKVCLIDLDYRKKGLTKEIIGSTEIKNFEEFNENRSEYEGEGESLFIPSFDIESPPDFFTSEEFSREIKKLKEEFDYILCDTPPWNLFVDAKIISKHFDNHIYVVANQISSFKDLDSFLGDFEDTSSIRFFYNKFNLYFNFLWYKYQYPYYSRNYYYDYSSYSELRKDFTFKTFLVELPTKFKNVIFKWVEIIKKRFFS
ncbi:Wzz/FepE/Etk N-terminal domain-containing protein [Gammaproteobacteria bacterium]|nr:Wzz/FepE/Etk N-terminal domain-containing protein [Gammaproteobacteria bacterium]